MMNLSQLCMHIYEALGEPEDLGEGGTPSTSGRLKDFANMAQVRLANWKFPNGRLLRFPMLYGVAMFRSVVKTGTVGAGYTNSLSLSSAVGNTLGQYNDWIVEISAGTGSGQKRVITSYGIASGTAYEYRAHIHSAWDTNPTDTSTYKVYKRFYKCLRTWDSFLSENISLNDLSDIMKIEDLADEAELDNDDRTIAVTSYLTDTGTPSSYLYFGNRIIFNTNVDSNRWFRIEYYRNPTEMSSASSKPELPEGWDQGIILYARWLGLARNQEAQMAYAAKKDLDDFIQGMRGFYEMRYERVRGRATVDLG